MNNKSDQILTQWLVLQIQSGHRAAAEALARQWYPLLHRYAASLLSNTEECKDVVQETLMHVFGRIKSLHDPAAFPQWVYRILHRRCIDTIRRRSPVAAFDQNDQPLTDTEVLVDWAGEQDMHQDMHMALSQLNPELYQVIHLYYLHDLGVQDIARIIAIPTGTVKSRLHSGRANLKGKLGGYEDERD